METRSVSLNRLHSNRPNARFKNAMLESAFGTPNSKSGEEFWSESLKKIPTRIVAAGLELVV